MMEYKKHASWTAQRGFIDEFQHIQPSDIFSLNNLEPQFIKLFCGDNPTYICVYWRILNKITHRSIQVASCKSVSISEKVFIPSISMSTTEVQTEGKANKQLFFKAHEVQGKIFPRNFPTYWPLKLPSVGF